jgi:hypothetical protein
MLKRMPSIRFGVMPRHNCSWRFAFATENNCHYAFAQINNASGIDFVRAPRTPFDSAPPAEKN